MPISVTCDCGRAMRLKDELAGKRVRCPGCQQPLSVPEAEEELEEVLPADDPPASRLRTKLRAEEEERPSRRSRLEDDDDEDVEEKPRPRRKRSRNADASGGGEGGSAMAAIGGGFLMMTIAVVWFVVGLMNNYIFFYPPVLFVLGIISIGKGIMDRG